MRSRCVGVPAILGWLAILATGCGGSGSQPGGQDPNVVVMIRWPSASDSGRVIPEEAQTIEITVTASFMEPATASASKSQVQGGVAEIKLFVPSGEDRKFIARAKTADGTVCAEGMKTVDVEPGILTQVAIVMSSVTPDLGSGNIIGRVVNPSGNPVAAARVWVDVSVTPRGRYVQQIEDLTGVDGTFELADVPVGTRTVNVQAGAFGLQVNAQVTKDHTTDLGDLVLGEGEGVRKMAVVFGYYDEIQDILSGLGYPRLSSPDDEGSGWVFYQEADDLFGDADLMSRYDLIFVNCGIQDEGTARNATMMGRLREWVEAGGRLYCSDWASIVVEGAFPEAITWVNDDDPWQARTGDGGTTTGTILSEPIRAVLDGAETVQLTLDPSPWSVTDSVADDVEVLIEAPVSWDEYGLPRISAGATAKRAAGDGRRRGNASGVKPVMVQWHQGDGVVIYTSFHNEPQIAEDIRAILDRVALGGV